MGGLLVERTGRAALLTLDRPERNELDAALLDELRAALAAADAEDAVDVIVLTATGEYFSGGLDLAAMADPDGGPEIASRVFADWRAWSPPRKPVLGAVNGHAERGGLELALQCDVVIASERATFADTHATLGFVPALGLTALLARAVGRADAVRMSLTGESVDAHQALRLGLVTEVVPHERLVPAALRIAETIAANDQPAVRSVLATYRAAAEADAGAALATELDGLLRTLETTPQSAVRDVVLDVVRQRVRGAQAPPPGP